MPSTMQGSMREHEIREALLGDLASRHTDDTLILEELGLDSGRTRVDVAVVNGKMAGFEIKSDRDVLDRLPAQSEAYCRIFDEMVLVSGERHVNSAIALVPEWWGLIVAQGSQLTSIRAAAPNPQVDPLSVARLLWRREALELVESLGRSGYGRRPRRELWDELVRSLPCEELAAAVRTRLKERRNWTTAQRREQGGAGSRVSAKLSPGRALPALPRAAR